MKSHFFVLFSLFFLCSIAFAAQPAEVVMKSLSYEPKVLQVQVGQGVRWKNTAYTEHSATSDDAVPSFDTGLVEPGKISKEVIFKKVGQFHYHCSIHGKTMSGVINVGALSAPGASQ
jgi:plastocyanin